MKKASRSFNGPYTGENLNRVAFPLGGLGAGMICLEGTGALSHVSLRHKPDIFNEPRLFSALYVKGAPTARVLEGPVPKWKAFGNRGTGNGSMGGCVGGLPRFSSCSFSSRFPFATVQLAEATMPVTVELAGWSPFIPGDADASSLPALALEYTFRNTSAALIDAVYSFHAANFMETGKNSGASVRPLSGGFALVQPPVENQPDAEGSFAAFVDDPEARSDCAWFRGGWFDPLTLLWKAVQAGEALSRPPHAEGKPGGGGSLYVPFSLKPDETKTLRLHIVWHVPHSSTASGGFSTQAQYLEDGWQVSRVQPPLDITAAPYVGLEQDAGWEAVASNQGFIDVHQMRADRGFVYLARRVRFEQATKKILHVGHDGGARLFVDGKAMAATGGTINPAPPKRTRATLDFAAGEHEICVALDRANGCGYGIYVSLEDPGADCACGTCGPDRASAYSPWYAGRFADVDAVAAFWRSDCERLRGESSKFSACFHDTTLPPEVVEAVAANLTILKSPTCLRQADGRFWGWEGCSDASGCCAGSCTHVWNYAQSLPHLFPALERTLRETEFGACQDDRGHQNFRAALPIGPDRHQAHAAADGQLGGILKVHREWRISGDTAWMKALWPKVRQSLLYCIETWDPDHNGVLVEPHHNTYDIEFWGADGMCTSFYLGALAAAVNLGRACGDDVGLFSALLAKGRRKMESELWNGAYFIQNTQWQGLRAPDPALFKPLAGSDQGYSTEALAILHQEGPKYQYGTGCLSDGVLGDWIARCCGVDTTLSPSRVKKHLASVFKHNFKADLSDHSNPQRPSYAVGDEAGLLLCSWPRGGKPSLPFVYSDEVWTGIEYQVASHLVMLGRVAEGLQVVRAVRSRYDGRVRNPFNEYECGHWYARAMASYALLQAFSGARYDAVDKTLHLSPALPGDFKAFLCTATGYGTVGLQAGKPFLTVHSGTIAVERIIFRGDVHG
jgi:uncharacterized protein (DUF608 family)